MKYICQLVFVSIFALSMNNSTAGASPWEEYEDAVGTFLGGYANPNQFQFHYANSVVSGIAGTWIDLNVLDGRADPSSPQPLTEDELGRMCGLPFVSDISVADPLSFVLVRAANSPQPVEMRFQALGGADFAFTSTPSQIMDRIGFDVEQTFEEERVQWPDLLAGSGGVAKVFAPSTNVRVFFPQNGATLILVRCD